MNMTRRRALQRASAGLSAIAATQLPAFSADANEQSDWLKISLQQYSFKSMLTGKQPTLKTIDYPKFAVEKCDIKALEYFNGFFEDKAGNEAYFRDLRKRCDDLGVENQLMLCRNKRALDHPSATVRAEAAKDYRPWLEAAKALGCHSIRVDVRSKGDADEVQKAAVDGLNQLCEIAKPFAVDIIIENHGNHSSNGAWVASLMKAVDRKNLGTLPDFGNFGNYDRYLGVTELLPWARAVCAKTHGFHQDGTEEQTDFARMLKIIKKSGFAGHIGIEYEGRKHSPVEGVLLTKKLIQKTLAEIG
ncbi:MAG: sugar phosphate isomerase/epimerase family protein [Fuerstiella sp.]